MVGKIFLSALILEASLVSGFPSIAEHVQSADVEERGIGIPPGIPFPEFPGRPKHAHYNKFDAKAQHVSTTGKHRFIKPKNSDIRGPCAGLNAAANHGYIPRNGIATRETILSGLHQAYGVAEDLLIFLETATSFFDGDPASGRWSIGGYSPKTALLGKAQENLIGNETGICDYGHLKTEGDASITRGDFLAPTKNDNCLSYPEFTQQLFDLADKMTGGHITPRVLAEHQYQRKLHSIATNPLYFSPVYAGVAFTFGAHMFAYELLANRSAEHPRGFLTQDVFMSFFSYHRKNGKLVSSPGNERIPDNWYRRALDNKWDASDVVLSTAQNCASYPTSCDIGGNTGTVNSFQGVNLADISGGFINSADDLKDPEKLGCFISQAIQADIPSLLNHQFAGTTLKLVKSLIPKKLEPALIGLGTCPGLPKGKSLFGVAGKKFPGAARKKGDKKRDLAFTM